jgi:hypothetical protein
MAGADVGAGAAGAAGAGCEGWEGCDGDEGCDEEGAADVGAGAGCDGCEAGAALLHANAPAIRVTKTITPMLLMLFEILPDCLNFITLFYYLPVFQIYIRPFDSFSV